MTNLEKLYGWAFKLETPEKEIADFLRSIPTSEKFENKKRGLRGEFIYEKKYVRGIGRIGRKNRVAYFETFDEDRQVTSTTRLNHRGKMI